jgi:hypothetical protein
MSAAIGSLISPIAMITTHIHVCTLSMLLPPGARVLDRLTSRERARLH